ncbi:hypothetical protein LFT44_15585 [Arthrobacter sp. FW306-05-C]|uniref:O-antigen ligase family protein n=1 Tax=Arthrobacter sp. FW306-05-C TaxID=2879620 RepID=UPI001F3CA5F1|nr:O-antigen ligase family protein [Arthrobacter sp. FW306-05-C]UKA65914.1 hypothetical protein LFT44_15585 [Arthrobacter sp. FW306-05-C]
MSNDKPFVNEFLLEPRPAALRLGLPTFMMAAVAALSVYDPGIAGTWGVWAAVAAVVLSRPWRLRIDAPFLLGALLVAFAAASSLWSEFPDASLGAARNYAVVVVMFIAARHVIQTIQQLRTVAVGYLTGCAVLVYRVWHENAKQVSGLEGGRLDLGGLNVNYAGYAFVAGFAMIALLWGTKRRTAGTRLWLAAAGASIVLGIVLSDTRGALIGLGLMVAWLLMCLAAKTPPMRLLVATVLAGAAAITTGAVDQASLAFENVFGRATGDWSGRLIIWPVARDFWVSGGNFWFGSGAGTFQLSNYFEVGAHNLILELGTGLGMVGVLMYVAVLWASLGKRAAGSDHRAAILIGCFIAASALSYLTGFWDHSPAAWIGVAVFSRLGLLDKDPAAHWSAVKPGAEKPKLSRAERKWLDGVQGSPRLSGR